MSPIISVVTAMETTSKTPRATRSVLDSGRSLGTGITLLRVAPALLLDCRALACGYDFGVRERQSIAIEVKGMKKKRGGIVFTDREWSEAKARRGDFWLVVVGNLETNPIAKLIPDPTAALQAECRYQTTIAASWQATVAVT